MLPEPTREAGLARLAEFAPRASRYAKQRNFDFGPGHHDAVSRLSPYLRTRLVTEEEVSHAVLERFARSTVDKLLQEVAWRAYFKGWLEMRPAVWDRYLAWLEENPPPAGYEDAIAGRSGIDCFDHWARELVETGYLHNHARMWFASIWIFTLRLPWQLGADFFLRHLLDGDPASNTLSWRWVAGLHTKGKHYLARASNIAKYTEGRFDPRGQLDESAAPLSEEHDFERQPLDLPPAEKSSGRVGHLLTPEDLAPLEADAVAGWYPDDPAVLGSPSDKVVDFRRGALEDTLQPHDGERLEGELQGALRDWIERERLDSVVVSFPTVGYWRPLIDALDPPVPLHRHVRDWDRQLWPHATAGFFKLKKKLPAFFDQLLEPRLL